MYDSREIIDGVAMRKVLFLIFLISVSLGLFGCSSEKISKEKYEQMLKSNPYFKELIDQLNLSPINIEEEEKDDFDDYLIRKDLPF